jgi:hypothetical protein
VTDAPVAGFVQVMRAPGAVTTCRVRAPDSSNQDTKWTVATSCSSTTNPQSSQVNVSSIETHSCTGGVARAMVATASAVRIAITSNIIVRRMVELLSSKNVTRPTLSHVTNAVLKQGQNRPKMGWWPGLRT